MRCGHTGICPGQSGNAPCGAEFRCHICLPHEEISFHSLCCGICHGYGAVRAALGVRRFIAASLTACRRQGSTCAPRRVGAHLAEEPRHFQRLRRGTGTAPYRLPISDAPAIAYGLPARDVSVGKPLLLLFLTSSFDILHSAFDILLCPCLCSSSFSYLLPPLYYRLRCPGGFCPFIQV